MLKTMTAEEFNTATTPRHPRVANAVGAVTSTVRARGPWSIVVSVILAVIVIFGVTVPNGNAHALDLSGAFKQCGDLTNSGRPLTSVDSGTMKMISLNGTGQTPDSAYGIAGAKYSWYVNEGSDNYGDRVGKSTLSPAPDFNSDSSDSPTGKCVGLFEQVSTSFGTGVNNFLFSITTLVYQVTAWVFQNAYSNSIAENVLSIIASPIKYMRDNLFLAAIPLTMLIVGGWIIVKSAKMQFRESLSGAGWALLMVILMSMLVFNPTFIPNLSSRITTGLNGAIIDVASSSNEIGYCKNASYEETDQQKAATVKVNSEAVAKGTCAMWSTFVFNPWTYGQFGKQPSELTKINGYSVPTDRTITTAGGSSDWALYQYAIQSKTSSDKEKSDASQATSFANIVDAVYSGSDVDHDLWNGSDAPGRMIPSLLGIISALLGGWLIGTLSLKVLVAGVAIPVMMFLLPFIALVAPHPTFGRKAVFRYFGQIAGFAVGQIVYSIVLMLALFLFMSASTMVSSGSVSWWYGIFMIFIFAFVLKKLLSMLEEMTNFGGVTPLMGENSPLGQRIKNTQRKAKIAGVAGVAGSVAGGVAAAKHLPITRSARQSMKDNAKESLAARGRDSSGHRIVDQKAEEEKKQKYLEGLKEEGLSLGDDRLIRDKDGNIDKRNWVDDGHGHKFAPNTRRAKNILEHQERDRKRKEDREARHARMKANRQAVAHQFKNSARAGISQATATAVGSYRSRTSLFLGTNRAIRDSRYGHEGKRTVAGSDAKFRRRHQRRGEREREREARRRQRSEERSNSNSNPEPSPSDTGRRRGGSEGRPTPPDEGSSSGSSGERRERRRRRPQPPN